MIKLDKIVENAMKRKYIDLWRPLSRKNPFFKKVAGQIAKNSRINV